jgi:phosphatidylglycerol:prolipoprotein diacylglycerol transferase
MHPKLFIGSPFQIPTWDFCMLVGFIFAVTFCIIKRPRDFPLSVFSMIALSILLMIFACYGGKFLYMYLHRYDMFKVMGRTLGTGLPSAGYAFLGGLFGELAALAVFTKFRPKRISFLVCADYLLPFFILHESFVRIGCFFAGCCRGIPTSMPWGCIFRHDGIRRHPTQLYEFAILVFTYFLMRHVYKKGVPKGVVFFGTIGTYTFLRFFVEYLRIDSVPYFGDITLAQVTVSAIAIICGIAVLAILKKEKK